VNQDRSCIANPVGGDASAALFCVFDGHGRHGHTVSQEVLTTLHLELERSTDLLASDPGAALIAAFEVVQAHLRSLGSQALVPARESGACAIVAHLTRTAITVAGAGDCRAVLARRRGGELLALPLSTDHKADSPGEQERIEATGATVTPSWGSDEESFRPARVYESETERWRGPGLTMSRVLGDTDAEKCGLLSTPEVQVHQIAPEDCFLIIGSDGIWEFIDDAEAVSIVSNAHKHGKSASQASSTLILRAALRWAQNEGGYRDDITATVVYLPQTLAAIVPLCKGAGDFEFVQSPQRALRRARLKSV